MVLMVVLMFHPTFTSAENTLPDALKIPEGYEVQLTLNAKGDQIYHCVLNSGTYTWKWHAPDAKLYNTKTSALVGNHGAGPSWTYIDDSNITAKILQKVDAKENATAPWLLLEVTAHKGEGVFAKIDFIQRINTFGGVAPSSGCDGNHLGSEKHVPYRADYIFYGK